jgi:hypothetical protein
MSASKLLIATIKGPTSFADGTANTTTTLADISPIKAFDPDDLDIGTIVRLRARGEYTCGTTATNVTIGFYYGGATANKPLASLTGQALTVSQTSVPWWAEYEGEIRAVGSSGSIKGSGFLKLATSLTAWTDLPMPATAAARTVTIDTTTRQPITVAASVSQITGAPTIIAYSLTVETLG